jgi:ATP-dependent helicase/nuclease subunit B
MSMRVFSVPASTPFLRALIAGLVDGKLVEGFAARERPERLASVTLYLPTRRAGRMAREIFLQELKTSAVILPRIVALGDIDEEELAFAQAASSDVASLDIPPALEGLPRRLMLAQLIATWARQIKPGDPAQAPLVIGGPASILALADNLARLMDDMVTRGVDWKALDGLVPDALDQYWQYTLRFLGIAREVWPDVLRAHGKIEPAARRDLLIEAEAARLTQHRDGPVIAAGSTGSMPSTAKFLQAVARLPQGAVVLPGLDTDLDDDAWQMIGGSDGVNSKAATSPSSNHPQYALHRLLDSFDIKRGDVEILGAPALHGRELLVSEAMRPSNATAQWHRRLAESDVANRISSGMQRLAIIAAANPEMEALAIAIAMREAHELGKSAALIAPDRALARRVTAALGRWNLLFDDSGGDPLMDTSAGIFARLAAETVSKRLEPVPLLALLKHRLCRLGAKQGAFKKTIETLELALLRGTRPSPGSIGMAEDFSRFRVQLAKFNRKEDSTLHHSELRAKLRDEQLAEAETLLAKLREALAPLERLEAASPQDFTQLAKWHRDVLIALSSDESGVAAAFEDHQGSALAAAFDDSLAEPASGLTVTLKDYPEVFEVAFADRTVRRPEMSDVSLRIYGPLEARLTQSDRVILGGLVEGVWPPSPRIDPWLSRPMRHELGLDLPERRIGLSAHDFAQLLGADDVILSHAAKTGGSPAVASRFLHRLEAVAGEERWKFALAAGERYLHFASELDRPHTVEPIAAPAPKPPRDARPLRLSVTAIEDWLRDPYTIYAKHILRLQPLDPVDMPLSAADRGSAIHNALGDFTQAHSKALPDDVARVLQEFGEKRFAPLMTRPEAKALWWPRFLRIASWFAGWENDRRINVRNIDAEAQGSISIRLDDKRAFVLSARADRIEHRTDRTFAILDYKTGAPPSAKQVYLGLSPQLTLEAAILRGGGFEGIPPGSSVSELLYVRLSGNRPPGEETLLELKLGKETKSANAAADEARQKLEEHVRSFDNDEKPYQSLVLSMWSDYYGQYDDLARIKEWSAGGFGEELE